MIILEPLIQIAMIAIDLYIWVVIISAILSWLVAFNVVNTSNRFVYTLGDALWRITEPALRPIRRILPSLGGIDISPIKVTRPQFDPAPKLNNRGALEVKGRYPTRPSEVLFDLRYVKEGGQWRLITINVRVKPVS